MINSGTTKALVTKRFRKPLKKTSKRKNTSMVGVLLLNSLQEIFIFPLKNHSPEKSPRPSSPGELKNLSPKTGYWNSISMWRSGEKVSSVWRRHRDHTLESLLPR